MQLNCFFLNGYMRGIFDRKDYRAGYIVFPIIGTYIDSVAEFQNDANLAGIMACLPI